MSIDSAYTTAPEIEARTATVSHHVAVTEQYLIQFDGFAAGRWIARTLGCQFPAGLPLAEFLALAHAARQSLEDVADVADSLGAMIERHHVVVDEGRVLRMRKARPHTKR
ncbi:hypothetical protein GQ85_17720 [Rhodococcus rhodochrous]|nr:hypothetical protein GQ85_17720 [Rhodococcus rhodochrous]